jgi:hypothetical protein
VLRERTIELVKLHADEDDCRIVAEAELLEANHLVTFDKQMQKRLSGAARIPIVSASELWRQLEIPRGTPPIREPHATNPLSQQEWWRWD